MIDRSLAPLEPLLPPARRRRLGLGIGGRRRLGLGVRGLRRGLAGLLAGVALAVGTTMPTGGYGLTVYDPANHGTAIQNLMETVATYVVSEAIQYGVDKAAAAIGAEGGFAGQLAVRGLYGLYSEGGGSTGLARTALDAIQLPTGWSQLLSGAVPQFGGDVMPDREILSGIDTAARFSRQFLGRDARRALDAGTSALQQVRTIERRRLEEMRNAQHDAQAIAWNALEGMSRAPGRLQAITQQAVGAATQREQVAVQGSIHLALLEELTALRALMAAHLRLVASTGQVADPLTGSGSEAAAAGTGQGAGQGSAGQ